ncbi:MAG: Uma2 family endonuclease [Bryobacterales bacterium]|nr:Uma2 family endonuclease [Bryobacterales bacterium]
MSASTLTDTHVPAVPEEAVAAEVPQADEVEYPEGHWVAQSVSHGDAVEQATGSLRHHFREREDVLVAMELVVYYRRGNNRVWLQPDVQVVHGVGRSPSRSTYLVWEEGKPPDFVLEVGSPSTADRDAQHKVGEYASVGVREYWRLDPAGELMAKPLEGCVARAGGYEPVPAVAAGGRTWLWSEVLGLELRGERRERGTVLVFRDPRTGEEWASADERERLAVERERQVAEERASAAQREREAAEREREAAEREREAAEREREAAEQRASAADARVRALEEQLRALSADTTNPSAGG